MKLVTTGPTFWVPPKQKEEEEPKKNYLPDASVKNLSQVPREFFMLGKNKMERNYMSDSDTILPMNEILKNSRDALQDAFYILVNRDTPYKGEKKQYDYDMSNLDGYNSHFIPDIMRNMSTEGGEFQVMYRTMKESGSASPFRELGMWEKRHENIKAMNPNVVGAKQIAAFVMRKPVSSIENVEDGLYARIPENKDKDIKTMTEDTWKLFYEQGRGCLDPNAIVNAIRIIDLKWSNAPGYKYSIQLIVAIPRGRGIPRYLVWDEEDEPKKENAWDKGGPQPKQENAWKKGLPPSLKPKEDKKDEQHPKEEKNAWKKGPPPTLKPNEEKKDEQHPKKDKKDEQHPKEEKNAWKKGPPPSLKPKEDKKDEQHPKKDKKDEQHPKEEKNAWKQGPPHRKKDKKDEQHPKEDKQENALENMGQGYIGSLNGTNSVSRKKNGTNSVSRKKIIYVQPKSNISENFVAIFSRFHFVNVEKTTEEEKEEEIQSLSKPETMKKMDDDVDEMQRKAVALKFAILDGGNYQDQLDVLNWLIKKKKENISLLQRLAGGGRIDVVMIIMDAREAWDEDKSIPAEEYGKLTSIYHKMLSMKFDDLRDYVAQKPLPFQSKRLETLFTKVAACIKKYDDVWSKQTFEAKTGKMKESTVGDSNSVVFSRAVHKKDVCLMKIWYATARKLRELVPVEKDPLLTSIRVEYACGVGDHEEVDLYSLKVGMQKGTEVHITISVVHLNGIAKRDNWELFTPFPITIGKRIIPSEIKLHHGLSILTREFNKNAGSKEDFHAMYLEYSNKEIDVDGVKVDLSSYAFLQEMEQKIKSQHDKFMESMKESGDLMQHIIELPMKECEETKEAFLYALDEMKMRLFWDTEMGSTTQRTQLRIRREYAYGTKKIRPDDPIRARSMRIDGIDGVWWSAKKNVYNEITGALITIHGRRLKYDTFRSLYSKVMIAMERKLQSMYGFYHLIRKVLSIVKKDVVVGFNVNTHKWVVYDKMDVSDSIVAEMEQTTQVYIIEPMMLRMVKIMELMDAMNAVAWEYANKYYEELTMNKKGLGKVLRMYTRNERTSNIEIWKQDRIRHLSLNLGEFVKIFDKIDANVLFYWLLLPSTWNLLYWNKGVNLAEDWKNADWDSKNVDLKSRNNKPLAAVVSMAKRLYHYYETSDYSVKEAVARYVNEVEADKVAKHGVMNFDPRGNFGSKLREERALLDPMIANLKLFYEFTKQISMRSMEWVKYEPRLKEWREDKHNLIVMHSGWFQFIHLYQVRDKETHFEDNLQKTLEYMKTGERVNVHDIMMDGYGLPIHVSKEQEEQEDHRKTIILSEMPMWMKDEGGGASSTESKMQMIFEDNLEWLQYMISDIFYTFKVPTIPKGQYGEMGKWTADDWDIRGEDKKEVWTPFVDMVLDVRQQLSNGVYAMEEKGIEVLQLYDNITAINGNIADEYSWKDIGQRQERMINEDEKRRKMYQEEAYKKQQMEKHEARERARRQKEKQEWEKQVEDRRKKEEEEKKKKEEKEAAAAEKRRKKEEEEKKKNEEEIKKNEEEIRRKMEEAKRKAGEKGEKTSSQLYLQSLIKQSEFMGRNRYFVHGKLSPMVYSQASKNVWCKCLVALFDGTKEYAIAQWRDVRSKINQCNDPELVAKLESCINNDHHSASVMRAIARKYGL